MPEPLHVAIIGSGPAGLYAAGQLLASSEPAFEVDVFDRLPTPWGLVRAGVAPDHPKIKSVTRVFEKTARKPGFRFHGNVEVGADVTHDELVAAYDAVLYCVGAAADRRLGIEGEDLPGSHPATEFVAWYNGHPDGADEAFDLSVKRAVVIGNGNVALDVARILVMGVESLKTTDIADHALASLAESAVEEVVVLGRRGPVQAAYTNPELLELGELDEADVIVDPADVQIDEHSRAALDAGADKTVRRNLEIVTEFAQREPAGKPRRIVLRFLASPVKILGTDRVEGIEVARNELVAREDGSLSAQPTGETEVIETGLVLRSIGYRGSPLPGVPFDERRGTILNADGRVLDPGSGEPLPGVYTAGWIKRGPSGVIGTNKKCAQDTVDRLLEDIAEGRLRGSRGDRADREALLARLDDDGIVRIDYAGWEAIDEHEKGLGVPHNRPRVKVVSRDELLEVAGKAGASG